MAFELRCPRLHFKTDPPALNSHETVVIRLDSSPLRKVIGRMLELKRRGLRSGYRLGNEVDVEGGQNPAHLVGKGYSATAGK